MFINVLCQKKLGKRFNNDNLDAFIFLCYTLITKREWNIINEVHMINAKITYK